MAFLILFAPRYKTKTTTTTATTTTKTITTTTTTKLNVPATRHVRLKDWSAQTIVHVRQKVKLKLTISTSHGILTPGQPVPALTL